MNTKARIATAVAAGYLLGRTKHLKLAIMVGGLIAGQKIPTNARDLSTELQKLVDGNEQLSQMSEQVRGELTNAAKAAAVQIATDRLGRVSDNLRQVGELPAGDEPEPDEAADDEEAEADEPSSEAPAKKAPAKQTAKKTSGTAKKATKKTSGTGTRSAKKAPAKKTAKRASSGAAKKTAKKASGASRSRSRS